MLRWNLEPAVADRDKRRGEVRQGMSYLPDFWVAWGRHEELLREAGRERLARELRRAREACGEEPPSNDARPDVAGRMVARRGLAEDSFRIAKLLELHGMPRWVAFEERFIVAERGGRIVAVLRFREDLRWLYLGLLVTDPRTDEDSSAESLYAGARMVARELGVREIRAGTRRHEAPLARAGYRKGREGWRLGVES